MKNNRIDDDYIDDILKSIDFIEKHTKNVSFEAFEKDELLYEAITRKIGIIGEAFGKLSFELREAYPEIPWREIIGMRNKIVHDYFGVDLYTVWLVSQDDIQSIKEFALTIKKS
jgi:uncharacterized protein with HEPN domain